MTARLDCRGVRARASSYHDGALDARSRGIVQEHLRTCSDCLAVYRENLALARAARGLPREPAPFKLGTKVRERLARRRSDVVGVLVEQRLPVSRRIAVAALALVLAILVGFVVGRCTQAPPAPLGATHPEKAPPRPQPEVEPPSRPTRLVPAIDAVPAGGPVRRSGH